ncbi:PilT-like protein [Thermacetogenium phaeum DSM 12270]|uniref:Ribonuclease VapC n=1 Tax=Thermacetogenium phaeum (strain ATCC BAA-254 / DSM 26808 / PB) TaxID=1089553 RepID=K4LQW6_THEPS|nr:type II toxin-antitoxin system VapC family toxin [Thermacetogenium phaeum]AFV10494.1 PilT-like protein [Thermacetogenium phaeum DSM 12270]
MAFLIDTCVLIDHLTGRLPSDASTWLEQVVTSGMAATSVIVYHELLFGARTEKARAAVEELLQAWSILPVDRQVARRAAEIRRDQAAQGRTLGMADCLIAATAELKGLKVVTANVEDFPSVEVVFPGGPAGGSSR